MGKRPGKTGLFPSLSCAGDADVWKEGEPAEKREVLFL